MDSDDINTQRVLSAVRRSLLAACMKVPHRKDPDFDEIKKRFVAALGTMEEKGIIASSSVRIIEDTPAEKLVREIMEEEEEEIRTEIELQPVTPLSYIRMEFKISDDS